jgi:formylglycine-generating enzyme required for sulfatase activity
MPSLRGWLERQPPAPMGVIGLALGAGVGAGALWGLGAWFGGLVCLMLVGLATALAWGSEPVLEVAIESPYEPPPAPPQEAPAVRNKPFVVEDIPGRLHMVELAGGTFWMGSEETDAEKPRHRVTVSDFAMMQTPVTRGLFRRVLGDQAGPTEWHEKGDDGGLPANYISWFVAVDFCNALSQQQGLTPCYQREGSNTVTWKREANGYRLASEAEWEYACRAGTDSRWFCGDDPQALADYAWFDKGWGEGPYPVAQKMPNPWGIHDMVGNVWEWCWDWYGPYAKGPQNNPTGPQEGESRSLRGGSFNFSAGDLRSADRDGFRPDRRLRVNGFRCVRAPRRQP